MGTRTHVGIADKHSNVQFVYGHWEGAALYRAGADILMGALDSEAYNIGRYHAIIRVWAGLKY